MTAGRDFFQRLRPCGVTAEFIFQRFLVIFTDIIQIVLILAAHLNAQGVFRVVFHGGHITGHNQNMQPPRQAVGIPCNRLGQCVFLRVAALFQTVQNDAHGRVIAVDSLAQRSCDELVEQFLFSKLGQRGAVFLIQLPQQALAVGRQTAGQQISKCLNHDTGVVVVRHISAEKQCSRRFWVVMGVVHRKRTFAHAGGTRHQATARGIGVLQPGIDFFPQPLTTCVVLIQQLLLTSHGILYVQFLPQFRDLSILFYMVRVAQPPDNVIHLGFEPFVVSLVTLGLFLFPVAHIEPLFKADRRRHVDYIFLLQQNRVNISARNAHRNGNFIQTYTSVTCGIGRQQRHDLTAVLNTLADFIPPQHPVLQLGGIHPRLEAIFRKICADILAHLLLYMAITDKDLVFVFHRTSSFPFFLYYTEILFLFHCIWREKILAYHISTRARGCFGGAVPEQFFLRLVVKQYALPCRAEAVL